MIPASKHTSKLTASGAIEQKSLMLTSTASIRDTNWRTFWEFGNRIDSSFHFWSALLRFALSWIFKAKLWKNHFSDGSRGLSVPHFKKSWLNQLSNLEISPFLEGRWGQMNRRFRVTVAHVGHPFVITWQCLPYTIRKSTDGVQMTPWNSWGEGKSMFDLHFRELTKCIYFNSKASM